MTVRAPYLSIASAPILAALSGSALADDRAACAEGIVTLKADFAERPAETVLCKAARVLRVAEREQGEFDECLEILNDAQRALKK